MIPRADVWQKRCDEMARLWSRFAEVGPELIRLATMPTTEVDGWPSSSLGPEVRGGAELTVPERGAEAGLVGSQPFDLVRSYLAEFFAVGAEVARITSPVLDRTRRMGRLEELITKRGDLKTRDAGAGPCLACGRNVPGSANDRLRGGHCEACHKAWQRSPERNLAVFRWTRYRRRCEDEGREPSWSEFQDLQKEAS